MQLTSNLREQWVEYPIGMVVFMLRFISRFKIAGWRNLYWDDLLAFMAMGTFVGLNEQTADALTDAQAASFSAGSKAFFAAWLCYISMIWCLKGSVLFFYNRLTLVKILGAITIASYLAMLLNILFRCRPIQRNWQSKPYAGDVCTLPIPSYWLLMVLNVSTDLGIMCFIPAPLLWKVKIPLRRKLAVVLLLFSGVFIMVAAILRCVLTITNIKEIDQATSWAIRETFVSIFAVNAPAIRPLFDRSRWLNNSSGNGGTGSQGRSNYMKNGDETELRTATHWSGKGDSSFRDPERESLNSSEENIIGMSGRKKAEKLEIQVTTAFDTANEETSETSAAPVETIGPLGGVTTKSRRVGDGWTKLAGSTSSTIVGGNT